MLPSVYLLFVTTVLVHTFSGIALILAIEYACLWLTTLITAFDIIWAKWVILILRNFF